MLNLSLYTTHSQTRTERVTTVTEFVTAIRTGANGLADTITKARNAYLTGSGSFTDDLPLKLPSKRSRSPKGLIVHLFAKFAYAICWWRGFKTLDWRWYSSFVRWGTEGIDLRNIRGELTSESRRPLLGFGVFTMSNPIQTPFQPFFQFQIIKVKMADSLNC